MDLPSLSTDSNAIVFQFRKVTVRFRAEFRERQAMELAEVIASEMIPQISLSGHRYSRTPWIVSTPSCMR
jgi:hypothetical protein